LYKKTVIVVIYGLDIQKLPLTVWQTGEHQRLTQALSTSMSKLYCTDLILHL